MVDRNLIIQRYFRRIYSDMQRRLDKYKEIQQIKNINLKKEEELRFFEEQKAIIKNFIANEKHSRRVLKSGLKRQQQDIEGWWKRNIGFRKVKHNCMDRFDNLIAFAKEVEEILSKEHFDEIDSRTLISEIENELKTIIHLSDDYEISRYKKSILEFCKRNKSPIALSILFIFISSLAIYVFSNYNIIPKDTQTRQVSFTLDDMHPFDWAQGAHLSYGFHTMLDRIVQHKSYLEGLQYRSYGDQRYGNQDANILEIYRGASELLPSLIKNTLGDDIVMEVQALNRGEVVIKIVQNNTPVIEITFNQDKAVHVQWNTYSYTNQQLEEMYHSIRKGLEYRVNTN